MILFPSYVGVLFMEIKLFPWWRWGCIWWCWWTEEQYPSCSFKLVGCL